MNKSQQQSEHSPEHVLLQYVDGELDAKRAAVIREHLEACWLCRTAMDELQETIRDYMHFHKNRIIPSIPRPPRYWHGFDGMLAQAGNESRSTHRWMNWFSLPRLVPRAVWLGSAVVACAVMLVVILEVTSSRASIARAAEVLNRAVVNEATAPSNQVRHVRVRFRGRAFIRSVGDVSAAEKDSTESLFRSSRLNWSYPLSARVFANWHNGLRRKSDQVTFGAERIAVETRTNDGQLQYASFTVRAADYHPIEESLDFGDAGRVDVSELPNEEVMARTPSTGTPKVLPPASRTLPQPLAYSEDDVEASVRLLLHLMGADIREVVSIRRSGDEIVVTGVVSEPDQKQEILNRIGALDHVSVQIQSAEEVVMQASSQSPTRFDQRSHQLYDAPAKPWLEQQFQNLDDREAFVHRALQLNRDISVRAYALAQLSVRYPPPVFSALSQGSKTKIAQIVADLAGGINEDQKALRTHLQPLVTESGTGVRSEAWQSAATKCLTLTRGVDNTLTSLFAASPQAPEEFNSLVARLRDQLFGDYGIQVE